MVFGIRTFNKTTITALAYALFTPLDVWLGFKLGTEDYSTAAVLLIVIMVLEFVCVKSWFNAQTDEIKQIIEKKGD